MYKIKKSKVEDISESLKEVILKVELYKPCLENIIEAIKNSLPNPVGVTMGVSVRYRNGKPEFATFNSFSGYLDWERIIDNQTKHDILMDAVEISKRR
jgi:hypothetical protein